MIIIPQDYEKITDKIVNKINFKQLKLIIGRKRLKFNKTNIKFYINILFEHSFSQKTFKFLHKKHKTKIKYSCFMNNIQLFSKLFKFLFHKFNQFLNIKPSKLLNIVDSTLISEKRTEFINQNDWNSGRVTTRIKDKIKVRVCGSKGLIFINRFNKIYYAERLNINESDQNILKSTAFYQYCLKGILLADRGFSNKTIRKRIKPYCNLISPYHYKEKLTLTDKEYILYKHRWKIETVFQKLKHNYADLKLNITGKYSQPIKTAKFYSTLIAFNLSN